VIRPIFPDNSAGLKSLANLSLYFMYMVMPFFLIYISLILRGSNLLMGQQVSIIALMIVLFITFFLPLGSVHATMKRAKIRELEELAHHSSRINLEIKQYLSRREYGEKFSADIEALEKIDFLYSKVEKMPVWPFNMGNLGRVILASMVPLFVFLLEQFTNPDSLVYHLDRLKLVFGVFE